MSAGKILGDVGHFFKHCAVFVGDSFVKIFGWRVENAGKPTWENCMTIVQEVAASAITSTEKHGIAFSKIGAAAAVAGIEAKDSLINMLIELAVQALKGGFGTAAKA